MAYPVRCRTTAATALGRELDWVRVREKAAKIITRRSLTMERKSTLAATERRAPLTLLPENLR
jgi:hypothetical protein